MLHHAFVPTHPEPTSQRYITKPQTLRFSSHTSVLNFAGTALHVTPRMWANPSWTNVPKHTTSFRSVNFHLTHPCFELCRSSSPYYTTHVCQPWTNVPKINHKTSDPKIFISHIPRFWKMCQVSNGNYMSAAKLCCHIRSLTPLDHLTHLANACECQQSSLNWGAGPCHFPISLVPPF